MMTGITRIGLAAAFLIALPLTRAGGSPAQPEKKGEHTAAHGGCLNALGACENGHAEVKLEGGTLKLWFVGGGTDTKKAVRVPDKELALSVPLAGASAPKPLILKAAPNELAEEKEGDCSHFEGTADWLNGAKKFTATGTVTFKGRQQEIRVEYPAGYDPDDAGADAGMKR